MLGEGHVVEAFGAAAEGGEGEIDLDGPLAVDHVDVAVAGHPTEPAKRGLAAEGDVQVGSLAVADVDSLLEGRVVEAPGDGHLEPTGGDRLTELALDAEAAAEAGVVAEELAVGVFTATVQATGRPVSASVTRPWRTPSARRDAGSSRTSKNRMLAFSRILWTARGVITTI